jgi:hypothetical protein
MVGFFSTGGLFMYPILVVFAIGVAIAAERYVTLNMIKKRNSDVWSTIQPLLKSGEFDKAREITTQDDSTISQVLSMGLARQGAVRRRDDIEIAMLLFQRHDVIRQSHQIVFTIDTRNLRYHRCAIANFDRVLTHDDLYTEDRGFLRPSARFTRQRQIDDDNAREYGRNQQKRHQHDHQIQEGRDIELNGQFRSTAVVVPLGHDC